MTRPKVIKKEYASSHSEAHRQAYSQPEYQYPSPTIERGRSAPPARSVEREHRRSRDDTRSVARAREASPGIYTQSVQKSYRAVEVGESSAPPPRVDAPRQRGARPRRLRHDPRTQARQRATAAAKKEVKATQVTKRVAGAAFSRMVIVQMVTWVFLIQIILHVLYLWMIWALSLLDQSYWDAFQEYGVVGAAISAATDVAQSLGFDVVPDSTILMFPLAIWTMVTWSVLFLSALTAWLTGLKPLDTPEKHTAYMAALILYFLPIIGMFPWGVFWALKLRQP